MPAKKKPTSTRRRRNKAATASVLREVSLLPGVDYATLTVVQLQAELAARGIKPASRRKADLIAALSKSDDTTPELPPRYNDEGVEIAWKAATVSWWKDLWASPMSKEYHESDQHQLYLLAMLVDQFWTNPSTKLAGEIRQQRAAFGLTPYDRRRLEWTIETAEGAKAAGQRRRGGPSPAPQPAAAEGKPDPRLTLVQ